MPTSVQAVSGAVVIRYPIRVGPERRRLVRVVQRALQ